MGSKPKKQDYEATQAEKTSASVAMAEYQRFKQLYDPLLQNMRDESLTDRNKTTLRGRASADTMQALTSAPSYRQTLNPDTAGDLAGSLQGQLNVANKSATDIQNTAQTNVLGIARGQAADAQTGMGNASRLATSAALERAKGRQLVADSKYKAAGQVAGAAISGLNEVGAFGDGKTSEFISLFQEAAGYQQPPRGR